MIRLMHLRKLSQLVKVCKPLNVRCFSESVVEQYFKKQPVPGAVDPATLPGPVSANGDKRLYYCNQAFTIRSMLTVGAVNALYWGSHVIHALLHEGEVVHGINIGIEPYWGYFGTFATFLIGYLARSYSHGAIIQAYESKDGQRIGFQMHNILGQPGKKIEVNVGHAKLIEPKEKYIRSPDDPLTPSLASRMIPSNNQIPVRIEGWKLNILMDKTGTFYDNYRIFDLLSTTREQAQLEITKQNIESATKKGWQNRKKGRKNE